MVQRLRVVLSHSFENRKREARAKGKIVEGMKKKLTILIVFILYSISTTQPIYANINLFQPKPERVAEIDELISQAQALYEEENFDRALELYEQIILQSEAKNYSRGLTKSYIGASSILFLQNKLDASAKYLALAKNESYAQLHPEEMYQILKNEGLNFHSLGLYNEAISKYKLALDQTSKFDEKKNQYNKKIGIYINIGDIFQATQQKDSAFYYYQMAADSRTTNLHYKLASYLSLADLYLDENDETNGLNYLNQAQKILPEVNSKVYTAIFTKIYGKYFDLKDDPKNAIVQYKKAYKLYEGLNTPDPNLLKKIADVYLRLGDSVQANQYLVDYIHINDSLSIAHKNNIQTPLILAKNDSYQKIQKAESKINYLVIGLVGIVLVGGAILYLNNKKLTKKFSNRKEEYKLLEKKLNSAFEEVADLAKSNSPNFLSRFIEVYPEFYNHLISYYPDLTNADLKLCALMKLDFSTKEISEITYSSVRTVQNRKYKLRKKFNLSPDENLNLWIQNLHLNSLTPH